MLIDDFDAASARVHARLAHDPRFEPLGPQLADAHRFRDYDLVSLIENRAGVVVDAARLDDAARAEWTPRVTSSKLDVVSPRSTYLRGYWLREAGERVGTVAVWTSTGGCATLLVSSLYVLPAARRRGIARRALVAIYDATTAEGLSGIRLETEWCWQTAVRFYCDLGMWVRMWKRDIQLTLRRDLPKWSVEDDGDVARFCIDGDRRVLLEALRERDRLVWREAPDMELEGDNEVQWLAAGTFAMALATRGWPLLRSDAHWREQLAQGFSDCGGPEGLAFRIRSYEAWACKHGWRVETPRIPGLDYPSWEDLGRR